MKITIENRHGILKTIELPEATPSGEQDQWQWAQELAEEMVPELRAAFDLHVKQRDPDFNVLSAGAMSKNRKSWREMNEHFDAEINAALKAEGLKPPEK